MRISPGADRTGSSGRPSEGRAATVGGPGTARWTRTMRPLSWSPNGACDVHDMLVRPVDDAPGAGLNSPRIPSARSGRGTVGQHGPTVRRWASMRQPRSRRATWEPRSRSGASRSQKGIAAATTAAGACPRRPYTRPKTHSEREVYTPKHSKPRRSRCRGGSRRRRRRLGVAPSPDRIGRSPASGTTSGRLHTRRSVRRLCAQRRTRLRAALGTGEALPAHLPAESRRGGSAVLPR